ncbi:MAG TPA: hypothetical protein VFN56_02425 [Candidatus Saccharimonadales bacterium]|nr:hypothetical protein [Candidatus Saccharimonadales bacterium]
MAAEVLNLPMQLADIPPAIQAPVEYDRSFLNKSLPMTPTDLLTGLPLPILPTAHFAPHADMHHHFHPKRSVELRGVGGQAVRCVRVQKVNYDTHHDDYHRNFYGPPLPETDEAKFFTVLMAMACVPNQAIAFRRGNPRIVTMTNTQRKRLYSFEHMRVNGQNIIRTFIGDYIVDQDIRGAGLTNATIDEFIYTTSRFRRAQLGHYILGLATVLATEPLEDPYRQACKQNLIHPGFPRTAQRFTKFHLGPPEAREKLIPRLREQLARAA